LLGGPSIIVEIDRRNNRMWKVDDVAKNVKFSIS